MIQKNHPFRPTATMIGISDLLAKVLQYSDQLSFIKGVDIAALLKGLLVFTLSYLTEQSVIQSTTK